MNVFFNKKHEQDRSHGWVYSNSHEWYFMVNKNIDVVLKYHECVIFKTILGVINSQ